MYLTSRSRASAWLLTRDAFDQQYAAARTQRPCIAGRGGYVYTYSTSYLHSAYTHWTQVAALLKQPNSGFRSGTAVTL